MDGPALDNHKKFTILLPLTLRMFQRIVILLLSIVSFFPILGQDDVRNLELSVNKSQPYVLDYDFCRLSITANNYDSPTVTIHINIENTNENYSIFLFGHAYTEKTLKAENILFDKLSYGTTSKDIIVCEGLSGDGIMRIEPNGNRVLTFPDITEQKIKIELPVYIAKFEKKKFLSNDRYLIKQRIKLIINITLSIPDITDDQLDKIEQKCNELIEKINSTTICTSRKHPVSETKQIDELTTEIDNLKDEIADIKSENHWRERDEAYKPYKHLLERLDNVKFNRSVCEECKRKSNINTDTAKRHNCNYCKKSPSEILLLLQRTYQELDNRKIKKSEALKKIEGAHSAWSKDCANLRRKINADSNTQYKIKKYYDAIVNY